MTPDFDPETQPLSGRYSIEASAGTGKTYSITLLWLRLIIEHSLSVDQILVSTFTTAATAELKERLLNSLRKAHETVRQLQLGQTPPECPEARILLANPSNSTNGWRDLYERLSSALSSFDTAPVSTIHSFCQSLISRHSIELGCDSGVSLVQDCDNFLKPLLHDQLMQMADAQGLQIDKLTAVGEAVAKNPAARLLKAGQSVRAALESVSEHICQAIPGALSRVTHAGSKKALTSVFEAFSTLREWKALTAPQASTLGTEFASLWNSYGTLNSELERIPNARMAEAISSLYPRAKTEAGVRGFDDILLTVQRALVEQGQNGPLGKAVRKRLRAAIIDECQDSDGVQIQVFEQLFLHHDTVSFIVIGDPKQSIYRFRGADLASYKRLVSRTEQTPPMTCNYRSDQPLVEAVNALYEPAFSFPDDLPEAIPTRYIPVTAHSSNSRIEDPRPVKPLVWQWCPESDRSLAESRLAEQVAKECSRLLHSGIQIEDRHSKTNRPIRPGDIAVLAAGHRELGIVRRKLTRVGIACQAGANSLGSVFGSAEALDVLCWLDLLAALEHRSDVLGHLLTFLGTPLGGLDPHSLQRLRTNPDGQAQWCETFTTELSKFERSGPLSLLVTQLGSNHTIAANLPFVEGERRYTNWRHIAALLQNEFSRGRKRPAALAQWLARLTESAPKTTSEDPNSSESALMKLETDASAVQLATIHASKGLEYPIVFCPFLWKVRSAETRKKSPFALFREQDGWALDVGSGNFSANLATSMQQEDEEGHRTLYVALTRARHRLYIGVAPVKAGRPHYLNGAENSPLAALPGLGLSQKPLDQWEETLKSFALASFDSAPVDGAPESLLESTTDSLAQSPPEAASAHLEAPKPIADYHFPLVRTASFSGLARTDHEHDSAADRDSMHPAEAPGDRAGAHVDLLKDLGEAGAALGDQLHSVLEDFMGNRRDLQEVLSEFKPMDAWINAVTSILDTPLPLPGSQGPSLRLLRDTCITEMQFHLPVEKLDPQTLADALSKAESLESNDPRKVWAADVADWGFTEFAGFLQGFIDLIFEHEDRWYVVDYKSNLLGDYSDPSIENAMLEHHYLLQARLYALALHRHLELHLKDYDFEKHFGGVAYLFVRGFPSQGVWFERPSLAALTELGAPFQSRLL